MANTRDLIGDIATIDGLVEDTLTEFEDDSVTTLPEWSLAYRNALTEVTLPSCASIDSFALYDCRGLRTVRVGRECFIEGQAFGSCRDLTSLVLTGETMSHAADSYTVLQSTNIFSGDGAIYVNDDLVDTYRDDDFWGAYLIAPVSSYPMQRFETVSDTWTEIAGASLDGTYDEKYQVGDVKYATIDESETNPFDDGGTFQFVLCAKNADILASDRTKTANMTWIMFRRLYGGESYDMRTTDPSTGNLVNSSRWAATGMRDTLANDVLMRFESGLRENVKPVVKYTYGYDDNGDPVSDIETIDTVWIPSAREMCLSPSHVESLGPSYQIFQSRQRRVFASSAGGSASMLYLRTSGSIGYFCGTSNGGSSFDEHYGYVYPLIGFCI